MNQDEFEQERVLKALQTFLQKSMPQRNVKWSQCLKTFGYKHEAKEPCWWNNLYRHNNKLQIDCNILQSHIRLGKVEPQGTKILFRTITGSKDTYLS